MTPASHDDDPDPSARPSGEGSTPDGTTRTADGPRRPLSCEDSVVPTDQSVADQTAETMLLRQRRPADRSLERGVMIGRYLVIDRIGAGGMGVVYRAYDPELDRRIAIKLLHISPSAGKSSSRPRARLLREAQALAQLSHPNVIAIHDVGTYDDDVFIAMELVDGRTLRKWIKGIKPEQQQIVDVFVAAGRGLAAAHGSGLIHRDFKPDNVIVGDDGRVRVLDFGLARAIDMATHDELSGDDDSDADTDADADADANANAATGDSNTPLTNSRSQLAAPLTVAGHLLGTPAYMAPEQHLGLAVDDKADQFAFCVSLYEALYGVRPFPGKTRDALSSRVCSGHVDEAPRGARVPTRWRRILLRGLAAEPDDRYASMNDLLNDLSRRPMSRRRIGAVIAVAAVAVSLLAVIMVTTRSSRLCTGASDRLRGVWDSEVSREVYRAFTASGRPYAADTFARVSRSLDGYAEAWTEMHSSACTATRISGEQSLQLLDLRMACLDRRRAALAALTRVFTTGVDAAVVDNAVGAVLALPPLADCADTDALTAVVPLPADPATRAKINEYDDALADIAALHNAGKFKLGLAAITPLIDEVNSLGYQPLIASANDLLGELLASTADEAGAVRAFTAAAAAAAAGHDDVVHARALISLLWSSGQGTGKPEATEVYAEVAHNAVMRAGATPDLMSRYASTYGVVLHRQGHYERALPLLERALAIKEGAFGDDDLRLTSTLNMLGEVHRARGDYEQARTCYQRAMEIQEQHIGPEHPDLSVTINNLGGLMVDLGDYVAARSYLERSLSIDETSLGPEHPRVATSLANLGGLLSTQGKGAEARPYLERAIALQEKSLAADHPDLAMSLHNLGSALFELGEYEASLHYCQRALAIFTKVLGPDHPHLAFPLQGVGNSLTELGRFSEARPYLERALAIQKKTLGDDHPYLAYTLNSLGACLLGMNDLGPAVAALEQTVTILVAKGVDPSGLAQARFTLAQVLWKAGRDRKRALSLAQTAREFFASSDEDNPGVLAEVDAWLREHR